MTLLVKLGERGCFLVCLLSVFADASHICSANHEKDDWINGEKTEDVVAFLDRLYTAKRKVEQRIVVLGGADDPVSAATHYFEELIYIGAEAVIFSSGSWD